MIHIREISRIVIQSTSKKVDLAPGIRAESCTDLHHAFMKGALSGKFKTDREAANALYGEQELSPRYRTLKARLQKKLLHSLFFLNLNPQTHSEQNIAYYQTAKQTFWAKILLRFSARNLGIKMALTALERSEKYNFTSNKLELLELLRSHHTLLGDRKGFEKYNQRLRETLKLYEAELRSTELHDRLSIEFIHRGTSKQELLELSNEASKTLQELLQHSNSYVLMLNYFRIEVIARAVQQEFDAALEICDKADAYLQTHQHLSTPMRRAEFMLHKLECILHIRDFEQGVLLAQECLKILPEGFNNWFAFMENFFLLQMHTKHFVEAFHTYQLVIRHPRLQAQPEHRIEKWKVFELYLSYALNLTGHQELAGRSAGTFNLRKFLRNVPSYAKDKQGFNVSILIMHILYLLDNGDLSSIISRMEALKSYQWRYLRSASSTQTAIFFRLLSLMEICGFDPKRLREQSQRDYKRLLQSQIYFSEISEGLQILPFDWLWTQVLEKLERISSASA